MFIDCVPDWGVWEGCREILQNAKDEDSRGHVMAVKYLPKKKLLRVSNNGALLSKKHMLYGYTDKKGKNDQIGEYGEGLKLGIIALLKAGHGVKIRNGSELWTPSFVFSKNFDNEKVLAFDTAKRKDCSGVIVEIIGVNLDDWKMLNHRILFLGDKKIESIDLDKGRLLLDKRLAGNIYIKGIFIEHKEDMTYGYDLFNAQTDRDRKMINSFDFSYEITALWEKLTKKDKNLYSAAFSLLSTNAADTEHFASRYCVDDIFADKIGEMFEEKHGKDSFPVRSMDDLNEVSHLGKQGIVVGSGLRKVLDKKYNLQELKTVGNEVRNEFDVGSLNSVERNNLLWVSRLVAFMGKEDLDKFLDIVEFMDDKIMGGYSRAQKRIRISRNVLVDKKDLLSTIIEELAHCTAGNHTVEFKEEMHKIYSSIIIGLQEKGSKF
jgi:hypothetical protein